VAEFWAPTGPDGADCYRCDDRAGRLVFPTRCRILAAEAVVAPSARDPVAYVAASDSLSLRTLLDSLRDARRMCISKVSKIRLALSPWIASTGR
jgi:hypothetical protein